MEEVVPMLINDHSHKTANDAIIVATAVLFNFTRSRNDPLDEPQHFPGDEEEVNDTHVGERVLGNAVRQALIMQHFT